MAERVGFDTFLLYTNTDNRGHFTVQHNLYITGANFDIYGITVAVQHHHGNWQTLETSNAFDNRFWWNDTVVEGTIGSSNFYNSPVKIIMFARYYAPEPAKP